jgi:dolichyl-diphosphooligosaccharide--protein glycosyltransferase
MLNSLMYRMSYYDFGKVMTMRDKPMGYDLVRNMEIGLKDYELKHLDEAFTSENWLVRIYKVRKPANRGQKDTPQKIPPQTSGWSSSSF